MNEALVGETISGVGIGAGALYVLYLVFRLAFEAINKRDTAFKEYVEANNHKSVEVMTECRDAIKAASKNMELSTKIQTKLVDRLDRMDKK